MDTRSLPAEKWLGSGIDHPTPSSTEVKEILQLHLYSPLDLDGLF